MCLNPTGQHCMEVTRKSVKKEPFFQKDFIRMVLKTVYGRIMTGMENFTEREITFRIKKLVCGNSLMKKGMLN